MLESISWNEKTREKKQAQISLHVNYLTGAGPIEPVSALMEL